MLRILLLCHSSRNDRDSSHRNWTRLVHTRWNILKNWTQQIHQDTRIETGQYLKYSDSGQVLSYRIYQMG